ncbi:MAG: hypothetical protein ACLP19_16085 [Xanthobacteraceae bacterium]
MATTAIYNDLIELTASILATTLPENADDFDDDDFRWLLKEIWLLRFGEDCTVTVATVAAEVAARAEAIRSSIYREAAAAALLAAWQVSFREEERAACN